MVEIIKTNEGLELVSRADYDKLAAECAMLKQAVADIHSELYGKGFEVLGWHLNGATEPLDAWFEDNDWNPETPATDTAIAEFKAQGADMVLRALVTSDDDDLQMRLQYAGMLPPSCVRG